MQNYGEHYGYSLIIKNHELSEYGMVDNPFLVGCDDGNGVYVRCGDCNEWMEFQKNKWVCPVCGSKILKKAAYEYIEYLNKEGLKDFDEDYEEYW